MKQTYEKPFSTVVQMATENIIAASEVYTLGATLTGPDDITNFVEGGVDQAW